MMRISLRHYRVLDNVEWEPDGVCALVGPNGSGKSTLLEALSFFRSCFNHDPVEAVSYTGGASSLANLASRSEIVKVHLDLDPLAWTITMRLSGASIDPYPAEIVKSGDRCLGQRMPGSLTVTFPNGDRKDSAQSVLRLVHDRGNAPEVDPMVALVRGFRCYNDYDLISLRKAGSKLDSDLYLHPNGGNVFSVLRNWRDQKRLEPQFEWVRERLKQAFPDVVSDLEFESAGQTVAARIFRPGCEESLPFNVESDGVLTALLHLTAVAGAQNDSVLGIDEVENYLHPHAIRSIVDAIRERAEAKALTVMLATHSPFILDLFDECPEQVFVQEPGRSPLPVRLTELHEQDWLGHFRLGRIYGTEYGSPRSPQRT